jgi:phospholipid/cholesterol/gamma-HCH transport system permease protein
VREPVLDFFSLLSVRSLIEPEARPPRPGIVERIGGLVCGACEGVAAGCELVGRSLGGLVLAPWRRERVRGQRLAEEIDVGGGGAVPIVALIGFLLGLILAMQAWVQLRVFAAEVFVADMVAVGVTREIGPLMTAILVAARSGSAIAAQLGTMVINEEVAALRQMGIHPNSYLVAPKIVALALATPALTALFCAASMVGGLLFAVVTIGTDAAAYCEQTRLALRLSDVTSAMLKATVFGALVAGVGCTLGLRVSDGAEGVGRATTRAVVASIFLIICFDAMFVVLLRVGLK